MKIILLLFYVFMLMTVRDILQITAHPSVAAHTLSDLEDVKKCSSTESTLVLIDTAGYAACSLLLLFARFLKIIG